MVFSCVVPSCVLNLFLALGIWPRLPILCMRRPPSFAHYEQTAILRNQTATFGPRRRAASLLLHMTDAARRVSMATGKAHIGTYGGAQRILQTLRGRLAPDAIGARFAPDAIRAGTSRNSRIPGASIRMDTSSMEFDVLRARAEGRMVAGSGFPDEPESILCLRDVAQSKN